ncbi:MAG TPA: sugar transferase [Terriglobia bacterium]|nr:sugar transferase [Terriglobia bacterium]
MTCASLGLVLLLPFFALVAIAIKLDDGGSVFYAHPRLGCNFRRFGLLKFRSMRPDAAQCGGPLTAAGDPRVTRVGRFLRRLKLDELPQLLNVLKGDLQLVGARPECERYVSVFQAEYAILLRERPGITDPASLLYCREEEMFVLGESVEEQYVSSILPGKLALSLSYANQRTFGRDLAIILRTVLKIAGQKSDVGSHSPGVGKSATVTRAANPQPDSEDERAKIVSCDSAIPILK